MSRINSHIYCTVHFEACDQTCRFEGSVDESLLDREVVWDVEFPVKAF